MPKFNVILPRIDWVDPGEGAYFHHPQTSRLRLSADSIISPSLVLLSWKEDYGKSDGSKYLTGLRLKSAEFDPEFETKELRIEKYKAIVPYSYESRFTYHFPLGSNLWLMFSVT